MQNLPLLELCIVTLLFIVTLIISYAVWYILFGHRMPLKEKKEPNRDNKQQDDCPLNQIMGYDFIQVKNIRQTSDYTESERTPIPQIHEYQPAALYATTNKQNIESEEENEIVQDNILDISNEDIEALANEPWEPGLSIEQQQMMANYYSSNIPYEESLDECESESEEREMEYEAEFDRYREEIYAKLEEAFQINDDERNALRALDEELESSLGSDIQNDDEAPVEIIIETDIPEI